MTTSRIALLVGLIAPFLLSSISATGSASPTHITASFKIMNPEDWYKPDRMGLTASHITGEIIGIKFGASWPESASLGLDCHPFQGASYSIPDDEYWVYRCQGRWLYSLAPRTDFIYLLGSATRPTLERVLLTFPGVPSGGPAYWQRLRAAVDDSLIRRTGRPRHVVPDTLVLRNGTVVTWTEGNDIECRSGALVSDLVRPTWAAGDTWEAEEDTISDGRAEVVRSLESADPTLAPALTSAAVSASDPQIVARALHRAAGASGSSGEHLIRYAAHLWAIRWAPRLPSRDTTLVHAFRLALSTYGGNIVDTNDGDWCYTGGFIEPLLTSPDDDRWTRHAFLQRMDEGWIEPCGLCGWGSPWHADYFRPTIERGEAFLRSHPKSPIAEEVRLIVAKAHETAWSLSKVSGDNEEYIDRNRYALDGPTHRIQAIAGYEAHLRRLPGDSRNDRIRRRLARLRIDVDTDYHRYWCIWD